MIGEDEDIDSGWGEDEEPQGPVAPAPSLAQSTVATESKARPLATPTPAKVEPPKKPSRPSLKSAPTKPDLGRIIAANAAAKAEAARVEAAKTAQTRTDTPKADLSKEISKGVATRPVQVSQEVLNASRPPPAAKAETPAHAEVAKSKPGAITKPALPAALEKAALSAAPGDASSSPKPRGSFGSKTNLAAARAKERESVAPGVPNKPASKVPPPKLAVGPRPETRLGLPLPPRSPMMGSSLREADAAKSLEESQGSRESVDELAQTREAPSAALLEAAVLEAEGLTDAGLSGEVPDDLELGLAPPAGKSIPPPTASEGGQPISAQPKSRSFTPRVSNAVQQAKELDVRAAGDANTPTPQGTSVVAAALASSRLRSSERPNERPTPLRMPSVTSREPGEAVRPLMDSKPASTSLRFQEQTRLKPPPRDRKQTLKLTVATQNFALDLLGGDDAQVARPKTRVSSPMLDLHLPDDLTSPIVPPPPPSDDHPHIEVSDEGHYSDSFDDLPIDEVLEAVRQSTMPPSPNSSDELGVDGAGRSIPPRRAPLPSAPLISDIPLEGPDSEPVSKDGPPVSDMPPTVRADPPDALRFGSKAGDASHADSEGTDELANDPRLGPIRDRFDRGDYAGALLRAEALLEEDPEHEGAKALVRNCQDRVKDMYISRLGSCDAVLRVVMSRADIQDLSFDHRGGFLISLIDGVATVDDVLDISGMPQLEALRLLYELKQEGVIDSSPPRG